VNYHGYFKLTHIGSQRDTLLNQLELMFIDFQTCLAIVDMLLKEEWALEVDYKQLQEYQKRLDDEIDDLNDWLSGGIFYLNNFLCLQLIDDLNLTFLFYLTSIVALKTSNEDFYVKMMLS
jgi:hypothetical protein